MITVPEFEASLRPVACSPFFSVPNFFCVNGVCMPSCPPRGLRQIFLLEKLKWKQFKISCCLWKEGYSCHSDTNVCCGISSIMQDVVSIEISSYISIYKPSNYSLLDISCNPIKSFQSREIIEPAQLLLNYSVRRRRKGQLANKSFI